jgi:hypothetical protein
MFDSSWTPLEWGILGFVVFLLLFIAVCGISTERKVKKDFDLKHKDDKE